jgi:hypothetical protein
MDKFQWAQSERNLANVRRQNITEALKMERDRPTIEECQSIGWKRFQDLADLESCTTAQDYFRRLQGLPWIRVREVIDHPLTDPGAFHLFMHEFVDVLKHIVINQRGPGILGYLQHLEFSFSPRVGASYDPQYRVVRLNLGLVLYANELEATYQWLESLIFKRTDTISVDEIVQLHTPFAVQNELTALLSAGKGGIPVSGHHGATHPIGRTLIRFVFAHELAHLVESVESPALQASWRTAAWSDYDDALDHCLSIGLIEQSRYTQLRRASLDAHVAIPWGNELVADGLGFYTLSQIPPPSDIEPRLALSLLQTAIEIFFHSLIVAYHGDIGTASHPPPTLRCFTIRAGQRKVCGVNWAEFYADYWGPGVITGDLLDSTIIKIGGRP